MAQNWTDNCFDPGNQGQTDLQNMENNMLCLKSNFEGTYAPSNPVKGQSWVYSAASALFRLRDMANAAWQDVWDFTNDRIATGKVKTASLADGVLSADTTGRAKMADGYITSVKINDVDGSKLAAASVATGKIAWGSAVATAANIVWHVDGDGYPVLASYAAPVLESVTTRSTSSLSYVKIKEIQVKRAGTYLVVFGLHAAGTAVSVYGRIYKNGSAVGTERNTALPAMYAETVTLSVDDYIQIYAKLSEAAASYAYVRNFALYATDPTWGTVTQD